MSSVRPIYKSKVGKTKVNNYRYLRILNCFSKISEKSLNVKLISPVNKLLTEFTFTYKQQEIGLPGAIKKTNQKNFDGKKIFKAIKNFRIFSHFKD